jgi:hypothetical protein
MPVKDLIRPLPGVRQLSLLRQRLDFNDSAASWTQTYARGGTSGAASYRTLLLARRRLPPGRGADFRNLDGAPVRCGQSLCLVSRLTRISETNDAPHVRHRCFSSRVDSNRSEWLLTDVAEGLASGSQAADCYVSGPSADSTPCCSSTDLASAK